MSHVVTPPARTARDPRLDFFRGVAMFIILLAHTRGNTWTLWIPARFGFSDATEIFVFCSGMASALAFGAVFAKKSWRLGAARILFRVWQVYWAHIGIFLVTAMMLFAIDHYGIGEAGRVYIRSPYVVPLFENTGEALLGLMTLSYVPGLFDILPMYLVILAMIPFVMAAHRLGGREAVFALILAMWVLTQFAGWHHGLNGGETHGLGRLADRIGASVAFLNLPSAPWSDRAAWFFNPFGWQLVFFTGFAFGMKWLPAPPVTRPLVLAALAVLILSLPFAWFKIHQGLYLPDEWWIHDQVYYARAWIEPLRAKSEQGLLRFVHFLALAYLFWAAVGPGGEKLLTGWAPPRPAGRRLLIAAGAVALVTAPYAYVHEIATWAPPLNALVVALYADAPRALFGFDLFLPEQRIGLAQIAHMIALMILVWAGIGAGWRARVTRDAVIAAVPVIMKVGTQSLAVFMTSIPLAQFNAFLLDHVGRDVWAKLCVNGFGIAVLIAVAYGVGWFKSQPWRGERAAARPSAGEAVEAAGRGGGGGGGAAGLVRERGVQEKMDR